MNISPHLLFIPASPPDLPLALPLAHGTSLSRSTAHVHTKCSPPPNSYTNPPLQDMQSMTTTPEIPFFSDSCSEAVLHLTITPHPPLPTPTSPPSLHSPISPLTPHLHTISSIPSPYLNRGADKSIGVIDDSPLISLRECESSPLKPIPRPKPKTPPTHQPTTPNPPPPTSQPLPLSITPLPPPISPPQLKRKQPHPARLVDMQPLPDDVRSAYIPFIAVTCWVDREGEWVDGVRVEGWGLGV